MKRFLLLLFFCVLSFATNATCREFIWPKNKMPHTQKHQIAAMSEDKKEKGFDADKHRIPYIEWFEAPPADKDNGGCMILISGGGYKSCCDVAYIKRWKERFTHLGFQCVNLVYRTPRPEGLPIYQTAWEDGQRAVRIIRSQAKKRGFDPEKIGIVSMSAGSHLGLLLATSSLTPAYGRIDKTDDIQCHINWAVIFAPAYATTDAENGTPSTRQGYGPDVFLSDIFKFDEKTCPMSLHHGANDTCAPYASTQIYRRLRSMGIPAELHLYADKGHKPYGLERGIEFMRQMGYMGQLETIDEDSDRFADDKHGYVYMKQELWPEGKMPDFRQDQCVPYIEWYMPDTLKTRAIQIIYSGGGYNRNNPDGEEMVRIRHFFNQKGMTVVAMKYRSPRPEGLAKHTTAWQDLQRAVRMVRSQAAERGLDPERIGLMGGSAGGHLTLMGVTSSRHQSYMRVDGIDDISCRVQWGIALYPAYILSDGFNGTNAHQGNSDNFTIAPEFSFDLDTAPMIFIHGDADVFSAMGSVRVWERMLMMGVQCDLHTLATRPHCFYKKAVPGTGSYTYLDRIWEFLTEKKFND